MRLAFAHVALVLLVSPSVFGGASADALIARHMEAKKVPGMSVAVIRDGVVVKAQGYGFANLEHRVPASAETIYQSGSVGKQFTAMLIVMLSQQGKIGLDDSLRKYFPDAPDAWTPITIRHLLTHTSGLSSDIYAKAIDLRRDYSEDELFEVLGTLPLEFQPGQRFSYSNAGYVLLGILIRKVTGRFYGDVLHDLIFQPAGMKTARIIDEGAIVPNRAAGYRLVEQELNNQNWVSPTLNTTADGSLYLSVLDLVKWDAALQGDQLVTPTVRQSMWTPYTLSDGNAGPYGLGWFVSQRNGHAVVEHGGSWQGFDTHIAHFPDQRLTVVVLANLRGAATGALAHALAGHYEAALALKERVAIRLDPAIFDEYVGEYDLNGRTVAVSREGDRFYVQLQSRPREEIFAESDTQFFHRDIDVQEIFVRDDEGRVTAMIIRQNGNEYVLKRVVK